MGLLAALSSARTEEDVKDAYIKALDLKKYSKGLIDIRTNEIWFEAKETNTPPTLMFAQLLCYVRDARKKGEHLPPFLAVIDRDKAALMETAKALPILADKSIKWPKSGSAVDKTTAVQMARKHGVRSSIVAFAGVGSAAWLDPFALNLVVRSIT